MSKLYTNRDYSPYSRERDKQVRGLNVKVESFKDVVLNEKKEILTNSGDPYKVFSYYRDKWVEREKPRPGETEDFRVPEVDSDDIPSLESLGYERPGGMEVWKGGREEGLERLSSSSRNWLKS